MGEKTTEKTLTAPGRMAYLLLLLQFFVYQHFASAAVLVPQVGSSDSRSLLDRVVDSILTDNDAELNNALRDVRAVKREAKPLADTAVPMNGPGTDINHKVRVKRAAPAFLASAASQIGEKVVNQLGDRIADGVVENHQEKVVNSLQDYFAKQLDSFDDQYKDALGKTIDLAAGLSRPVEEADVRVLPISRGDNLGNSFVPAGYEISHKYHYADETDDEQDSSTAAVSAYSYPVGLGPVLMNGCFGTGYVNGDPCWEAKIPRESCPDLIDGATFLGVGFDGRGEYSADSRKRSIVQRSCNGLQTYEDHEVPDTMTVQGVYDTDVESNTFASMEGYREYLEQKSAVTSAKAMFQQELNKAAGYGAGGGIFGLGYSVGGGFSDQSARYDQSSNFGAGSQAEGRLTDKNTQTYMALLEINVFRYEIFMDDVEPADLNLAFLRDFLKLPVSYFSIGADQQFQNFILRYGTHYIKSAKFGGQLKIIKTKEASSDLSIQAFSERAQTEWKKAFSTFSAEASQTKSSSWWHEHETRKESQQAEGEAEADTEATAAQSQTENLHSFEFSNEMMVVQGGDQRIAAAITEMYTSSLSTELKTWLESIKDYPKAFSFIMKPITSVLDINFDSLFPQGAVDFGCLGKSSLKVENGTGRRYYVQKTTKIVGNTTQDISEVRYCDFNREEELAEKVTKRRLALDRAITVYLEEGPLLSTDFLLPAGEPGCETATLAYLDDSHSGAPTWAELVSGAESTVIFDMPYDIASILQAREILTLKFHNNRWYSVRTGNIPHLYDGYNNGNSNDVNGNKVSVQGLVMTYDEETGVLTVGDTDFEASKQAVPELPDWVKGQALARVEYKSLLKHLSNQQTVTNGDAPCNIKWSNAHRIDPTDGGKCIHFTAASEGDIFVVFAGIPRNYETWLYIQISPEGVALYKAMRLETTQLKDGASSLGSSNLYQSYFVCVTEDTVSGATTVQYGKTPDNEERPHIWRRGCSTYLHGASSMEPAPWSGMYPVKVMGVSLVDQPAQDFIVCREGTEKDDGRCKQRCHSECDGCRTTGSDSPTDCIACRHFSVAYPYIDGSPGSSKCVAACPEHMELMADTNKCTCKKQMETSSEGGRVTCVTDCPLTHYLVEGVCKKCHSFCQDVSGQGIQVCTGPNSNQCHTCKYAVDGVCSEGCSPGQKAVKLADGSFRCDQCQSGYKCVRGDELEEMCPAGTHSNHDRTSCPQCPAGRYSGSGASSCTPCPAGQFNPSSGSSSCQSCSAGMTSNAGASSCYEINECASNPCQNGAQCENRMNSYYCRCAAGYQGTNCETDINECSSNPCQHGGTCTDRVNGFSCACNTGYAGDTCGTDLDYEIRLMGSSHPWEGRLEIRYRDGAWGTVCDDRWDANDAAVACRQLGYQNGVYVALTLKFGAGSGGKESIFLDEVGCSGSESNLDHCSHPSHGTHDCSHSEDVGIICSVCRSGWTQHGDKCYQITNGDYTFATAKIICDDGGSLAMPKDQATNDVLVNMIKETSTEKGTWIGLDDLQSVGTYTWDDGTSLSYTNWGPGEPSTAHERCVMYFSGITNDDQKYKWNDSTCETKGMFICQQNRHY